MLRVGIGEQQPSAFCLLHADPEGMVLANPSIGQSAGFEQAQVWNFLHEATHDPSSPIRGLIVYHQDFGNFRLVRQGSNTRRNHRLLIPGGDNDRDGACGRLCDKSSGGRCVVIGAGHIFWMRKARFPTEGD